MIASGIRAFISVRKRASGNYDYVIGKISDYINFPVEDIFRALNEAEGTKDDRWGGATTIGGSPRVGGSKMTPDQVETIINQMLNKC